MNENCTVTITSIGGNEETFTVSGVNKPYWDGCLTPEDYAHRVGEYGITIETLDQDGCVIVRHITPICICEINVFCPCTTP